VLFLHRLQPVARIGRMESSRPVGGPSACRVEACNGAAETSRSGTDRAPSGRALPVVARTTDDQLALLEDAAPGRATTEEREPNTMTPIQASNCSPDSSMK